MLHLAAAAGVVAILAAPLAAQERDADALYDTLRLGELIGIMREEGLAYVRDLEIELLDGRGGPAWNRSVERIYDLDVMESRIAEEFSRNLDGTALDPLFEFFGSENGREIVALEIEARRALQDEDVATAAEARAAAMRADGDERIDLLDRFVEVNDLVEANVAGALNANYAFYRAMADGGAFGPDMSEDQIIGDIWAQEPEIRAESTEWLFGYLALAYQPLSDADLESYTELGETGPGQALNAAIFGAFDKLYVEISTELGENAARLMSGEDI